MLGLAILNEFEGRRPDLQERPPALALAGVESPAGGPNSRRRLLHNGTTTGVNGYPACCDIWG